MEQADCPHPYRFHKYNLIPKRPRNNDQLFRLENIFQVQNANHLIWNGSWILHSVAGRKTICLFCCLHLLIYDSPPGYITLVANFTICSKFLSKLWWENISMGVRQTVSNTNRPRFIQKLDNEEVFWRDLLHFFYANYIFLTEINWVPIECFFAMYSWKLRSWGEGRGWILGEMWLWGLLVFQRRGSRGVDKRRHFKQ